MRRKDVSSQLPEDLGREKGPRRALQRLASARRRIARAVSVLVALTVCYGLLVWNSSGTKLELAAGDVAKETILAPRAVEDTVSTEAAREAARNAVSEKFVQDQSTTDSVLADITGAFESLATIRSAAQEDRILVTQEQQAAAQNPIQTISPTPVPTPVPTPSPKADEDGEEEGVQQEATAVPTPEPTPIPTPVPTPTPVYQDGYHAEFIASAMDEMPDFFTYQDLTALLALTDSDFDSVRQIVMEQVSASLESGIKEGLLDIEISKIGDNLTNPLRNLSSSAQRIGMEIVNRYLRANLLADEEATLEAREDAAASVANVIVREGQAIVREGEVVTDAQYQMLVNLGLVSGDTEVRWQPYAAYLMLFALLVIVLWMYLSGFEKAELLTKYNLVLWVMVVTLTAVLTFLTVHVSPYLVVTGLAAMLVACLFNRRMAMVTQTVLALYVGLLVYASGNATVADMVPVILASIVSGILAVNLINRRSSRSAFIWVGLATGAAQGLLYAAFAFLQGAMDWSRLGSFALVGLSCGILSGVLALGTMPLWEAVFQLNTPMKMMELCNPNQPLLKRLLVEAPGTYHHSVIVGNLAEAAAEEIGCNPLLVRVGAYYHDIGKLSRPVFFKENQTGPNPHDDISPELSSRILVAHVTDGVEMARKARLPQEIIDMIATHHGDTMQTYFYYKAKQTAEHPESLREEDFRYPGPKPSTREAALIMMADSTEAAVRSLKHPTEESIETMVRNVIKGKFNDNQLDLCDVTLRDIERIIQVFIRILRSVYHERIEYPSMEAVNGQTTSAQKPAPTAREPEAPVQDIPDENAPEEEE